MECNEIYVYMLYNRVAYVHNNVLHGDLSEAISEDEDFKDP
jgi:hypothetical protein